jgi:hypothetical protein
MNSMKGGKYAMTYEKPEVVVLGSAADVIQSNKPYFGEPLMTDPHSIIDTEVGE